MLLGGLEVRNFHIPMFMFACATMALTPIATAGTLIDGSQLHISGDAQVAATSLTWQCNQAGDTACTIPPAGKGDFAVSASTGSFTEYNTTFGLIADINNATQPLNALFSLMNFMTFDLNNDLSIELTFIPLGNDPASATCQNLAHCTPQNDLLMTPSNPLGLSAFNLDSNLSGTAATFGVIGIVHQPTGPDANLSGIFTAEFVGLNPQQTLMLAEGGSNSTFSSNLSLTLTVTPEPASMLLTGIGLLVLGIIGRRVRVR
jgi:hypothetical protein